MRGLVGALLVVAVAAAVALTRPPPKKEVVIVKLGGAAITRKSEPRRLAQAALEECAEAVAAAHDRGVRVVLVHGAGSFGHFEAKQYGVATGASPPLGFALTRQAVTLLSSHVVDALVKRGVPAVSLSPVAFLEPSMMRLGKLTRRGEAAVAAAAARILDSGLTPVVHGDAVLDADRTSSILSGDDIVVAVAKATSSRVVFVTDVDGVYDRPPTDPEARLLQHIVPGAAVEAGATGTDVTGGMRAKLDAAYRCARAGAPVRILAVPRFSAALLRFADVQPSTLVSCI